MSNKRTRFIQKQESRQVPSLPHTPLLTIQIDLGNDNIVELQTKETDDPLKLSQDFCRRYNF
jgi:hypothetical protein